ncbi:Integrase-type DNA-binding superfamily protein [Perilla frutescens var. hirtella]|uniref:Integrase-type DNA-binding superfamily protein n=1 Tax=Perilla frutescens var. hirtella TaxID=608512 RepID=A0AAD4PCN9_PERFH|nr:Integrase-type DNA-binding superfamily protein [Perilla frutescens var. hirtella]
MSSSSDDGNGGDAAAQRKYKGIRRRKWGKWVSEIRVPGTPERLWLGSYATPEAAAVAHDVAFYCLRGDSSPQNLNFPLVLPAGARPGMSPRSVQKAASDAGLAIDARFIDSREDGKNLNEREQNSNASRKSDEFLNISVEDYM